MKTGFAWTIAALTVAFGPHGATADDKTPPPVAVERPRYPPGPPGMTPRIERICATDKGPAIRITERATPQYRFIILLDGKALTALTRQGGEVEVPGNICNDQRCVSQPMTVHLVDPASPRPGDTWYGYFKWQGPKNSMSWGFKTPVIDARTPKCREAEG